MNNADNYQINYWGSGKTYEYGSSKPKRSIKRKLAIVFSFLFILAVTPVVIFALSNLDLSKENKISSISSQPKPENEPDLKVTIEEPAALLNQSVVINNDSYWKISKRVCGTGAYYLSIQAQNGGKALYLGDTVTANCSL